MNPKEKIIQHGIGQGEDHSAAETQDEFGSGVPFKGW